MWRFGWFAWLLAAAVMLGPAAAVAAVVARGLHQHGLFGTTGQSWPLVLTAASTWTSLILAVVAGRALVENERLSVAAQEQAKAGRDQAEASLAVAKAEVAQAEAGERQVKASEAVLEAMRLDRVLAWRPNLSATRVDLSTVPLPSGGEYVSSNWVVSNAGPGPALFCKIMVFPRG